MPQNASTSTQIQTFVLGFYFTADTDSHTAHLLSLLVKTGTVGMTGMIFSFDSRGNSPSEFSPRGFSSQHLPTPTTLPDFLAWGPKGDKNPVIQQR